MQKLTQWFNSQIGTKETGENNVIYNTHFYGGPVNGSQFPWCMAFIWDGFMQNGMASIFCGGQKSAYCPFVLGWAKANNQFVTEGFREGDILLYDQNGDGVADHTGYCLQWDGNNGYAIEGNYANAVAKVHRYSSEVLGAYRPKYPAENSIQEETPTAPVVPENTDNYTVQKGDTLWGIAEQLLGNGILFREIMVENGLTSDTIYPGQVLKIPSSEYKTISITLKTELYESLLTEASIRGITVGDVIAKLYQVVENGDDILW